MMDQRFIFVYIAVNVFCFIVTSIILSKFTLNVGSERDVIIFRRMTLCFLGYLAFELVWILSIAGILPLPPKVYGLVKVFGTFFIPLKVYFWFTFAENRFKTKFNESKTAQVIAMIPIVLLGILYLTSFFTGLVFKINGNNEISSGSADMASGLVNNIYGAAIIIHAVYLLLKEKRKENRSKYYIQIVFILICTIGGVLDAMIQNTPIMPLAICLSFIYLFINIQEPQIYNDALTGLNNRRRTDVYLSELIHDYEEGEVLHVFMMDIDHFKMINDTYGHIEGDQALQIVAKALASVTNEYPRSFVSRWGGDEFVMILFGDDDNLEDIIKEKIDKELETLTKENNLKYPLKMSVGHTIYSPSKHENIHTLIDDADKQLYLDKSRIK